MGFFDYFAYLRLNGRLFFGPNDDRWCWVVNWLSSDRRAHCISGCDSYNVCNQHSDRLSKGSVALVVICDWNDSTSIGDRNRVRVFMAGLETISRYRLSCSAVSA